jgi:tetratricopeptide (TPR) repeat protein
MAGRLRLTLAVLAASAPAIAAADEARWTEVRTPHFQVITDARPASARRTALRLERFRAVVGQLFPEAPRDDATPVTVLLFRNGRSMRPFLPLHQGKPETVAGIFLGGHDRHYMAIDAQSGAAGYSTALHEYVHLLNARVEKVPLWMNEGLAELYGNAGIDGDRVLIGAPLLDHLRTMADTGRLLPVREVLEADAQSPHYHEEDTRGLFYAQSWALVHYLLLGSSGHPRPLRAYMSALAGGATVAEASRRAWGLELDALQREMVRYVRGWTYTGVRVTVKPLPEAEVSEAPLPPAQVEFYKGDFLVHDRRRQDARPYLERAMVLDPSLPGPYRALGLAHYYAQERTEALRWLGAAIERDPDDGVARYFRARATLESGGPLIGPALAAAVHDDLRVAAARNPGLLDARELLAKVERVLGSASSLKR